MNQRLTKKAKIWALIMPLPVRFECLMLIEWGLGYKVGLHDNGGL